MTFKKKKKHLKQASPQADELEIKGETKLYQLIAGRVGGIVQDRAKQDILPLATACRLSRLSPMTQLAFYFKFFLNGLLSLLTSLSLMSPPLHTKYSSGRCVLGQVA